MHKISKINAHKVLNSRGDWTISVTVTLEGDFKGTQFVEEGASKGEREAVCISAEQAVMSINTKLSQKLVGAVFESCEHFDKYLIDLDGTPNKSNLGGNTLLGLSLAFSQACAHSSKLPLYKYLDKVFHKGRFSKMFTFPTPLFNVINGGKHAHNGLSLQEFMVIPSTKFKYPQALEVGVKVYKNIKKILEDGGFNTGVGDEGGFSPSDFTTKKALDLIRQAINISYKAGSDVFMGMDVAAESFYKNQKYLIPEEKLNLSSSELGDYYESLMKKYELILLEDPFYENDTLGWRSFYERNSNKLMIVGDDLIVTNPEILTGVIKHKLANAVIVKPNQVGTLTETLEFIRIAKDKGLKIVVSHRSGDTAEDTFIADLAVAVGADFIKSGAPVRGERVAKYNRLLEIYLTQ